MVLHISWPDYIYHQHNQADRSRCSEDRHHYLFSVEIGCFFLFAFLHQFVRVVAVYGLASCLELALARSSCTRCPPLGGGYYRVFDRGLEERDGGLIYLIMDWAEDMVRILSRSFAKKSFRIHARP
jgi:hypothetical protein